MTHRLCREKPHGQAIFHTTPGGAPGSGGARRRLLPVIWLFQGIGEGNGEEEDGGNSTTVAHESCIGAEFA